MKALSSAKFLKKESVTLTLKKTYENKFAHFSDSKGSGATSDYERGSVSYKLDWNVFESNKAPKEMSMNYILSDKQQCIKEYDEFELRFAWISGKTVGYSDKSIVKGENWTVICRISTDEFTRLEGRSIEEIIEEQLSRDYKPLWFYCKNSF
ncbi:MAG: hypothetical protein ABIF08_04515 [Nanoarchaeota archaeon]